jgi:hypothetical protein
VHSATQAKGPTADDNTDSEDEAVLSLVAARKIANWVANVRAWVITTHAESSGADLFDGRNYGVFQKGTPNVVHRTVRSAT